ncbi:MAG: Mevalonate kinase [Candidatus Fermentimicrarchaeum limneticum]|uniref:Mevalonate kinase n=1 Tax=Fermentimicrarchaeum limneticum TaxID=2795018 RepID=A0A7D5XL23_FERL1|nr:MAG: Mevalonate kinase [Candidatus Fermentimicrarchaeum limneticum]
MASAPGSLKLFGEHAVVYNRLALSAAFNRRAFCEVSPVQRGITVNLKDLGKRRKFNFNEVLRSYTELKGMVERGDMHGLAKARKDVFSPYKMILGDFFREFGFTAIDVSINSDVPRNSGLGSSAAVFCSLAAALNSFVHGGLGREQLAELANLGDKVVHGNPSGLDASTCTFGGYISFRRGEGINPLKIKTEVPMLVVNTGSQKDTGEMIGRVAERYKTDKRGVGRIFDRMEDTALSGIRALKSSNLKKLGGNMNTAQECFRELGLSTPGIEKIIETAMNNGALGAKITGAGGGGCVIILTKEPGELTSIYKRMGCESFQTLLGVEGVK